MSVSFKDAFKQQATTDWSTVNMGGLLSAGVGLAGKAINPNGNSLGVGNFISGAGDVVGMINPIWGAAIKGVGMLTNAAFGSNVNQGAVDSSINALGSARSNIGSALTWDALGANMQELNGINLNQDYGSQGWFNHDLDTAKNRINQAYENTLGAIKYASNNILTNDYLNMLGHASADGGPIFKTDYDVNLSFINNGGTHESNPYGGVFFGIAPDGQPNLLEEGEVVYNDYVYSNRIPVPKAIRKKYKMREGGKLSFADAVTEYIKKNDIEERENDSIAMRGFEAFANELAQNQEEIKARREMRRLRNSFDLGGHIFDGLSGSSTLQRPWIGYDREELAPDYADAASYYMRALSWLQDPKNEAWRHKLQNDITGGIYDDPNGPKKINGVKIDDSNWYKLATDGKVGPVHNAIMNWAKNNEALWNTPLGISDDNLLNSGIVGMRPLGKDGNLVDTNAVWNFASNKGGLTYNPAIEQTPKLAGFKTTEEYLKDPSKGIRETEGSGEGTEGGEGYDSEYWLGKLGLGLNAAGLMYNIFDPYHPQVVNEVNGYDRISPRYLGDYMTFNPYDINYATSQQDANSAATLNALRQSVAPISNAAILANDFNNNATRGATRRQALEYNDQFRKAVADFNRQTNQFNAQMALDAAARNQAARQAYYEGRLKQGQFNSQLDFQHKMMRDQAIGQGLTSIADYLRDIEKEGIQGEWTRGVVDSGATGVLSDPMKRAYTYVPSASKWRNTSKDKDKKNNGRR